MVAIVFLLLIVWLRYEAKAMRDWAEHPSRPWMIQKAAEEANIAWQRAAYEARRSSPTPVSDQRLPQH